MSIEFKNFEEVLSAAKSLSAMPVAVIDADEPHVIEGACRAAEEGFIDPVLIGDEKVIRQFLESMNCKAELTIIHAPTAAGMAEKGVELLEKGTVKALMKGHIHTADFLHPILADHLQGERRISHVYLADIKKYPKLLYITDAAINIAPDLMTKMHITQNAVDMCRVMGVEEPKVAALSALEDVNPDIPSTIDAACLAKMGDRGQITGAVVDGPLAFDNAISAEAAEIKGIRSSVSGDVDILVVPDLVSGNILGKDLEYLAGAQMAGFVVGVKVPIILTSRSDPLSARIISCAVANLVSHRQEEKGAGRSI